MTTKTKPAACKATLRTNCRITIPAELRERLGWRDGELVVIEEAKGGILLRAARRRFDDDNEPVRTPP